MIGMPRIGPFSQSGGESWCTCAPIAHISRSAITIDRPIVTMVWRRSCPCMKRKIDTCISRPASAATAKPTTSASTKEPVYCAVKKPR